MADCSPEIKRCIRSKQNSNAFTARKRKTADFMELDSEVNNCLLREQIIIHNAYNFQRKLC